MRTNTTKAKLAEGKVVFGAIISRHAPDLVELFGAMLHCAGHRSSAMYASNPSWR